MQRRAFLLGSLFATACGLDEFGVKKPKQVDNPLPHLFAKYPLRWRPSFSYDSTVYIAKHDKDGDSMLWNGLMSLTGNKMAQAAVRAMFEDDGRPRRNPNRVGSFEPEDSFSRDSMLGFLCYLVATKDRVLARRFQRWFEAHGELLCVATDDKCELMGTYWGTMSKVWSYIGLEPSKSMKKGLEGHDMMMEMECRLARPGFRAHLPSLQILIARLCGRSTWRLDVGMKLLFERDPDNVWFSFMHEGISERTRHLIEQQYPRRKPRTINQWSFERASTERAWTDSMGWEWLLLNHLIRSM